MNQIKSISTQLFVIDYKRRLNVIKHSPAGYITSITINKLMRFAQLSRSTETRRKWGPTRNTQHNCVLFLASCLCSIQRCLFDSTKRIVTLQNLGSRADFDRQRRRVLLKRNQSVLVPKAVLVAYQPVCAMVVCLLFIVQLIS